MSYSFASLRLEYKKGENTMIYDSYIPAIEETIRQNEIGDASPYVLSFAELGKSGASFGFMQGDTNVSDLARSTLRSVLSAAGVGVGDISSILTALNAPLPNGNPLSNADTTTVNNALSAPLGKALVDQMDKTLLKTVFQGLDACVAAVTARGLALAPIAYLYIAPWINMSGPPSLMIAWLQGAAVHGVPSPAGSTVTQQDMQAYLQSTAYFEGHPRNFIHYQECVRLGATLLPTA